MTRGRYPANKNSWNIWIDTGGTFTDCLAVDDGGVLHRRKILSNSALRGAIDEVINPQELRVSVKWDIPKGLIHGFQFRLLGVRHPEVTVDKYDRSEFKIALDKPLPER